MFSFSVERENLRYLMYILNYYGKRHPYQYQRNPDLIFRNVNGPRNLTNKVAEVYLVNKCCTLKKGSLFSVGHTSIRPIDSSPRPTKVHLSPSANHGIQVFSSAYIHCTCMINFNNIWAEQSRNPISFSKYLLYSAFICHSKSHVTKYGREWH